MYLIHHSCHTCMYAHSHQLFSVMQCFIHRFDSILQWKPFLKFSYEERACLLCTRLLSVFACLLGCSQLTLAVWAVIWLGVVGAGPQPTPLSSSSIIDLRGPQALWGHLALLPAISGQIDRRGHPSAETRGQFQRPPAHFLPPGVPFRTKGTFPFHSLHPPLPFSEQVKDMKLVLLLPVISSASSPVAHTGRKGERSVSSTTQSLTHLMWKSAFDLIGEQGMHVSISGHIVIFMEWQASSGLQSLI